MNERDFGMNRRHLLKLLGAGALATGITRCIPGNDKTGDPQDGPPGKATFEKINTPSTVSLVRGNDCRDNTFRTLMQIEDDIMASLEGKKRILVKPNFVSTDIPLCATSVDAVRGILDFLRPRWKGPVTVGESTASRAGTFDGYRNYGYLPLEKEYGVSLADLNEQPFVYRYVFGPGNAPLPTRIISTFLDRDQYLISAAKMKTHDRVLVTLSMKNILLAAPLNQYGVHNDKGNFHARGIANREKDTVLHYNMFHMANEIYPDLGVIDGFEAMEGNGPTRGTPVDARVAMASLDPLALDTLCTKIMGFDPGEILYLASMHMAGMGQGDLDKIVTVGAAKEDFGFHFKPSPMLMEAYGLG